MSISVACHCGKQFALDHSLAGKRITCLSCRRHLAVPGLAADEVPLKPIDDEDGLELVDEVLEPDLEPLGDEEESAIYTVNPEDARLEARLRGAPTGDELRLGGEVGCFHLSSGDRTVTCLACSPDNRHALAGLDRFLFFLDLHTGEIAGKFTRHERPVCGVAFGPDGRRALSGDDDGGLLLWDPIRGRAVRWLEGHRGAVGAVAFAPDGRRALSGGDDGRLLLWDLDRGEELARLAESSRSITAVAFAPDGRLALTGDTAGRVRLWDVRGGRRLRDLVGPPLGCVTSVAFTADGRRALAGGSARVLAGRPPVGRWEVPGGRPVPCFASPSPNGTTIRCVAFSPDGSRVLAGGGRDYSQGKQGLGKRYQDDPDRCVTPARLWDVESGHIVRSFVGHRKKRSLIQGVFALATISCVAITADGRRGLSGANDGTVRVWGLG